MLQQLHIENIAVIRQLDLDFTNGFTVLSGETGAGKSVILDSIRLILGERGDKELIRYGENAAYVSALFSDIPKSACGFLQELSLGTDEDGMIFLERTLTQEGKSTAKWNGRPVPISLLKKGGEFLLSIHAQNTTTELMRVETQRALLDSYADTEGLLSEYAPLYRAYTELCQEEKKLLAIGAEKARMLDVLRYQISDIEAVSPKIGEEDKLFDKRLLLRNKEKITKQASFVYRALRGAEKGSVRDLLCRSIRALSQLSDYLPEAEMLSNSLDACISECDEVAERIFPFAEDDGENPAYLLDKVEGRLEEYARLHRKYGERTEDILSFYEEKKQELSHYENADKELSDIKKAKKNAFVALKNKAEEVHAARAAAAGRLTLAITEALVYLDMPKVVFRVSVTPVEGEAYTAYGNDSVSFLVAANPGEEPQPISSVASGGELSRIMLAVKSVLSEKEEIATVIYDEVDTGVSGKTARKIGLKLRMTAKNMQTLCITHSAQIASLADRHILVAKQEKNGRSETYAKILSEEERVEELARIIGGLTLTEVQRKAARDLLAQEGCEV